MQRKDLFYVNNKYGLKSIPWNYILSRATCVPLSNILHLWDQRWRRWKNYLIKIKLLSELLGDEEFYTARNFKTIPVHCSTSIDKGNLYIFFIFFRNKAKYTLLLVHFLLLLRLLVLFSILCMYSLFVLSSCHNFHSTYFLM